MLKRYSQENRKKNTLYEVLRIPSYAFFAICMTKYEFRAASKHGLLRLFIKEAMYTYIFSYREISQGTSPYVCYTATVGRKEKAKKEKEIWKSRAVV